MKSPFRLPPDEVARICVHLLEYQWDWTVGGLDEALAGIGWAVHKREPDRQLLRLVSEHPLLRGLATFLEPGDNVISIVLSVTGSAEEDDGYGQAQLDGAAEVLAASLPSILGFPDQHDGGRPVWSGPVCDVELRRESLGVSVAAVNRMHLARYRGEAEEQRPVSAGRRHPSSSGGAWEALGVGLGRLLGSLTRFDWVSFKVDDVAVLAASRDDDLWVLAIGPDDTVEPIHLSDDQQVALADLGFHPPLGEGAEHGTQRENWWLQVPLPADPLALESTGHLMASALRNVYGAEQPSAIVWFSMSPNEEARWVLDSLEITRSEFQDDR